MIGVKEIILRVDSALFHIYAGSRFTIIKGLSGTGKSYFIESILNARPIRREEILSDSWDIETEFAYIYSDVPVIAVASLQDLSNVDPMMGCVYVFDDELCALLNENDTAISKFVCSLTTKRGGETVYSNSYFIFMTRDLVRDIEYDVLEVYKFRKRFNNNCIEYTLRHYIKWCEFDTNVKLDALVTEGEGSDFALFDKLLACNVVGAGGKSRIAKTVSSLLERDKNIGVVCVVADGCVFGGYIDALLDIKNLNDIRLVLFLPSSFEYIILKSDLIHTNEDLIDNASDYFNSVKFYSYENYYESLLKKIVVKMRNKNYIKEGGNGVVYYPTYPKYSKSKSSKFTKEILLSSWGMESMIKALQLIEEELYTLYLSSEEAEDEDDED